LAEGVFGLSSSLSESKLISGFGFDNPDRFAELFDELLPLLPVLPPVATGAGSSDFGALKPTIQPVFFF